MKLDTEPIDTADSNKNTHNSDEECVDAEAWLSEEADEPEEIEDAHGITFRYTCPVCDREWEYYYTLEGLWNPRDEDYQWTA